MAIEWATSSEKHGIPRGDALFAIQNYVFWSDSVDAPVGAPAYPRKVFIGPPHAQTDQLIEVLVELRASGFVVYHVMNLGPKYRRLMEDGQ